MLRNRALAAAFPAALCGVIGLLPGTAAQAAGPVAVLAKPLAVTTVPFDFNGDGFAEIVVGAPYEDAGKATNAGAVTVVPGSASGPLYAKTTTWSQDSPGVPGGGESGDHFGYAQTSGDYDGDGYADLLITAPGERIGSRAAGMVTVLRGSAAGLVGSGAVSKELPSLGVNGKAGRWAVSGDFDGDGYDDVAVSDSANCGFNVLQGSSTGLVFPGPQDVNAVWDYSDLPGEYVDLAQELSFSMAVGDVNDDGYADLAVSDPWSTQDHEYPTGSVLLVPGGAQGLAADQATLWTLDTDGIVGESSRGDVGDGNGTHRFGFQVALGDVDEDGYADLLATSPGAPVDRSGTREDAGALNLIRGSEDGLTTDGNLQFTEESPGIPGLAVTDDEFGITLAVADFDRDGAADVAVGVGAEQSVIVLPGGSTFGAAGAMWTQDSGGVPGGSETGDCFGCYARWVPTRGTDAGMQLVVGAPGENSAEGVAYLFNTVSGGLTTSGVTVLSQDTPGVPGTAEKGDSFGHV